MPCRRGRLVDETQGIELTDFVAECWRTVETTAAELVVEDELAL